MMVTQRELEQWAGATDLGRHIFNHNFQLLGRETPGWSLVKATTPHSDESLTERIYVWQHSDTPERLIRVDLAELAGWREAQLYLADTLGESMRPEITRPRDMLKLAGDVQFVASSAGVDHPETVRFARGNVAVAVSSVGSDSTDVSELALVIDRELSDLPIQKHRSDTMAVRISMSRTAAFEERILALDPQDRSWIKLFVPHGELQRKGNAVVVRPDDGAGSLEQKVLVERHDPASSVKSPSGRRAKDRTRHVRFVAADTASKDSTAKPDDLTDMLVSTAFRGKVVNEDLPLINLTADIVAAHVSNNSVGVSDLPLLISNVHEALSDLGGPVEEPKAKEEPKVSIRSSVKPDYIVCLEDGKKLKMLTRYLITHYNMTPDEYRQKWGLSADYPMVAPNYAEQRRTLAKKIGPGTKLRHTSRSK